MQLGWTPPPAPLVGQQWSRVLRIGLCSIFVAAKAIQVRKDDLRTSETDGHDDGWAMMAMMAMDSVAWTRSPKKGPWARSDGWS